MRRLFQCFVHCLLALGLALCAGLAGAAAPAALVLDDARPEVALWPALRLLADPSLDLGLDAVRQRVREFQPPTGPQANLGVRREAVWLHLPVQVAGGDGQWLLEIAYPLLGRADVYLLRGGQLVQQARLGANQPYADRPRPGRTHTLALHLPPGQAHELYIRVQHEGTMVLPMTLSKPAHQQEAEGGRLLLQGLLMGVALALLVYSLAHWASLRERMFGLYALLLLGTTVFFLDFTGLAQQYTASQRVGLLAMVSPLSVLVALAAGSQFVALSLHTRRHSPRVHQGLKVLAATAVVVLVLSLLGLVDGTLCRLLATMLGPVAPVLAIPAAWRRVQQGDQAARYILVGWCIYGVGAFSMAGLMLGWLPANGLSLNLYQWCSMLEMLAWLRVLGLHIESVRRHAERTALEHAALLSMAHTDPLTGLPNRRGLQQSLAQMLPLARGDSAVVVYLLDLDGFKPVNDRLGHDAGDELLVQVGQRLKQQLRRSDVVARLGGDEFVIATASVASEAEALVLGRKLLAAFDLPFNVAGQACRVGLTIGFALAPHDGREAEALLKRADAAMYAGKQAGRHTVRRGGASIGLVSS